MDWKLFAVTFGTIFLAEMGDKTQLATIALTGESKKILTVFLGAACALVLTSLIGVLVGGIISRYVPEQVIQKIAALFFIVTGVLFFFGKPAHINLTTTQSRHFTTVFYYAVTCHRHILLTIKYYWLQKSYFHNTPLF